MSNETKQTRTVVHVGKDRLKHVDLKCIDISTDLKFQVRATHLFQFMYDRFGEAAIELFRTEYKEHGALPPLNNYEEPTP